MNNVYLIGNLVTDPEKFQTKNGTAGRVRVAVNSRLGENEETLYMDVKLFGKTSNDIDAYSLSKGDRVHVVGRLVSEEFNNKEGQKVTKVLVYANQVSKIEKRKVVEQVATQPDGDSPF
jgi:single stranded DNA-binding protein